MLFHLSIDARAPRRVAEVLAELMGGHAVPFAPVRGGWIALAGDDRNTAIEVYPHGTLLTETEGDADAGSYIDEFAVWLRGSPTHFALATPLTTDEVFAIAEREGWSAKYRCRGGLFGVIEVWIENLRMAEILTADMQAEYLASMPSGEHRSLRRNRAEAAQESVVGGGYAAPQASCSRNPDQAPSVFAQ